VQVAAGQEFLNEKAGHDRLASTGIVRQKETQGLAGQHFSINPGNLVR
jgi:hypothetical protein